MILIRMLLVSFGQRIQWGICGICTIYIKSHYLG